MQSLFLVWTLVAIPMIGILYCLGFIIKNSPQKKFYVIPKCSASFMCIGSAALAITAAGHQPLTHLLFWALVFCMAGDFFIEYKLEAGGTCFAAAHGLLLAYTLMQAPMHPAGIALWIAGMIIMLLLFLKHIPKMGRRIFVLVPYAALLVADFAFAAVLPWTAGIKYTPLAIGLLSFLISDIILGKRKFLKNQLTLSKILMVLYYLALYLISVNLWLTI